MKVIYLLSANLLKLVSLGLVEEPWGEQLNTPKMRNLKQLCISLEMYGAKKIL